MSTCFIYLNSFNENGFLSVSLDPHQQLSAPLEYRLPEALIELQKNSKTILIVSAKHFSFHRLELPWLAEKKARIAIPYALEDKFAESVEDLHFAFNRQYYSQGHYLIAACKKSFMLDLIKTIEEQGIRFDILTIDWFSLNKHEVCITDQYILVDDDCYCGALSGVLAELYLKKLPLENILHTFKDSMKFTTETATQHDEDSSLWIAQRLAQNKAFNLCQGDFQHGSESINKKRWFFATALTGCLWIILVLFNNVLRNYQLNQEIASTDMEIARIYRQFFPQAQQVISPRFRIEQLLKSKGNNGDNAFWVLLNQLAKLMDLNITEIEQMRYQNQSLQVTLISKDFDTLERLENKLQQAKISVKQIQASTREKKVVSTLELSL